MADVARWFAIRCAGRFIPRRMRRQDAGAFGFRADRDRGDSGPNRHGRVDRAVPASAPPSQSPSQHVATGFADFRIEISISSLSRHGTGSRVRAPPINAVRPVGDVACFLHHRSDMLDVRSSGRSFRTERNEPGSSTDGPLSNRKVMQ
ncbi:hypothetical protein [Burkholderia sp. IDO3]|uniref:hypothetical protein n=1 Tax=Burkholderia sp. IDO3 TaxID=1705310 RepID=UPI001177C7D2|nr:hypothetical protein [Burkholderia sp. IDO3]